MSNNSSFDSEKSDEDSIEEDDTKSITEKEKDKAKSSIKENEEIQNIELINAISNTLTTILEKNVR